MKYIIDCRACGGYEVDMDVRPCFCPKCASASICVAPVKTKARLTAERKMFELDEIKPRLEKAREEYFALRVEYEDCLQYLSQYHRRKIVSDEEYDTYRIKEQSLVKGLNDRLKEHRAKKKQEAAV